MLPLTLVNGVGILSQKSQRSRSLETIL